MSTKTNSPNPTESDYPTKPDFFQKRLFKKKFLTVWFVIFLVQPEYIFGMVAPHTASLMNFFMGFGIGSFAHGDTKGFIKFMPSELAAAGAILSGVYMLSTLCSDNFSPYAEAGYERGFNTWSSSLANLLSINSSHMKNFKGVGQWSTRVNVFDGYVVGATVLTVFAVIPFIVLRISAVIRPFVFERSLNRPNFNLPRLKLPKVPVFPDLSIRLNSNGTVDFFGGIYIFPQKKRIYKHG